MSHITRRAFLASPAVAASSLSARAGEKRLPFFEPVAPPRRVQVVAHRGLAQLAPENTRFAVEACAGDLIEWAEIGVRLTKDGKHVVFHDDRLDGKTDGSGPAAGLVLDRLQALDAGSWFAPRFAAARLLSLSEALALAKGKVNLSLDCKSVDPELLAREVQAAGMEQQVVALAPPATLAAVRKASRGAVPTIAEYRPASDFDTFITDVAPTAVEIGAADVTPELCKKFRAAGVIVRANALGAKWDAPETWLKTAAAGAVWLKTDNPGGARTALMRERGAKWPVRVAHHRGANRYAPENTLPAIRTAVGLGADFVEVDVRTTKDGKFVLMHDSTVNRTTNGKGKVADLTLDEIRKLDAGAWFGKPFAGTTVPTLDEALAALGDRASVYLDAKDVGPEALAAAVKAHGLFDRHVVYQSAEYGARLKKLDARLRPLPPLKTLADLERVAETKPYGVDASWRALSKELIAACHAKGIQVFADALGLNESVEQYRRAMGWGIDVIQTDHPLRVLRAVELDAATRR
ncbi:glycerophosphodiester phosphodiesterase family protein [Gemmata sp. JC717]|uniref:glycerophosphodiester phosphodiesterase n=1 Tax=Gemmata algarum TaxID=2975278 RepID=UPI0021BAB4A0|nr:glycerophosphodiester phosphodiesterase family protein [Gemmata algarum]MDY3552274.1 glycerophosphodiester phosphodiesterase family protein [Gemmata algarum]